MGSTVPWTAGQRRGGAHPPSLVILCSAIMNISTSTSIVIPRPRPEVFAFACDNGTYERNLRPRGLIAGIDKAKMVEGQVLEQGAWRRITMTDGSVLKEQVLDYDPPTRHRYRWTEGVKPPFSFLVRSGTGCWDFSEVDGGTRIEWSYVFELKSPLAYPLLLLVVPLFRGWQKQGLEAMRAELS
jgi:hypothetical protein